VLSKGRRKWRESRTDKSNFICGILDDGHERNGKEGKREGGATGWRPKFSSTLQILSE